MTEEEELDEVEKEAHMNKRSQLLLKVIGAAIFGALSAVSYPLLKPLIDATRVPQGLALFDPISIIWVTCFLIFGPYAGVLCCLIGFVTLIPFDQSIPIIAPFLKFSATIPLIIIPTLVLRLYKKRENINRSQKLLKPFNYFVSGALSIVVRIMVMILLNIIVYLAFFGRAGLEAWLVLIVIVNAITSVWDLFVPYIIIKGLNIYKEFQIW
ncbi:MAG: hypothetical protein ACQERB_09300 [Promethearchaeati archaeon]